MARIWMILLALCAMATCVIGQDGNYRLKPEDVVRIQVYNETTIVAVTPVDRSGNISAPYVGLLRAEGKTTSELETELAKLFEEKLRLRNPKVAVTIDRYRDVRASVVGMVSRPGVFPLRPGDTILSLLAQGGGPIVDRANLRRAIFRRSGTSEQIPIDLYAMLNGDTSQNYVVEDGDELAIPEDFRNQISVQGAVAAPNQYPYREGMTLSQAISFARGEIPSRSKMSEVYVIRERAGTPGAFYRIKCNYVNFIRKGDSSQNIALLPGDTIFVSYNRTPNFSEISSIINSAFFLERFLTDGFFGLRLLGR